MPSSVHHNNKLIRIILIAFLFLSACENKSISVDLKNLSYDKESQVLSADFYTNIPLGTEVGGAIHTPNGDLFHAIEPVEIEKENENRVEFHITDDMIQGLQDGFYFLEMFIEINENKDFYNHDLGGSQLQVSRRYESSEDVSVSKALDSVGDAYTLYIKSSELNFETGLTDEERKIALENAQAEEAVEESEEVEADIQETIGKTEYSSSFKEYNDMYYKSFRNQLDLIGSNFEILAMDGYENQNIVDDLIRWTSEFNELLNVYEVNAIPATEKDEELYVHTIQMIEHQRGANGYIITGLTERDDLSFFIAGEHLYTITDMFLEGLEMLN
ncbi:hypothetical protein [Planococcus salinus]|uniref:Uncharacterized protein n=1 Tax=Planococcus salinus TaxID=1848460 RepID=A0A3M8P7F2_9BACL|nr:hypothetical protein [Planococcus salinus]RNF39618.1 hypothetical protein EEX84_09100 [Planococcus salinus]